jgi:branched-chain amino acid transport system substrate-binding protein
MKFFIKSIALLILFLPIAATSGNEQKVKVGLIFGETRYSSKGPMLDVLSARLAVEELNSQGGLLGRQVELVELDNKNTPLGSRAAAQKAVKEGVLAVIGPTASSHALLAAQVLQEAKIPMISYFSTNPEVTQTGDYIFRTCFTDRLQSEILAKFAIQDLRAKTAVVLTCSGEKYSIGLSKSFTEYFKRNGGVILWQGDYVNEATEFKELLEKVKVLKPDIIFLSGYDRASGFIIKEARNLGISVTFLGGDAWSNSLYQYGGKAIEGSYYTGHWSLSSETKISREFVNKYKGKYPDDEIVNFGIMHDAIFLLADAVNRARSLDRAQIRDALAHTKNFIGVTGNITMDKNRDPRKPVAIFKFENGSSIYIKTIYP